MKRPTRHDPFVVAVVRSSDGATFQGVHCPTCHHGRDAEWSPSASAAKITANLHTQHGREHPLHSDATIAHPAGAAR